MSDPTEHHQEDRTINGTVFEIDRLVWADGAVLYDVSVIENGGADLITTGESLDHIPTDTEIVALYDRHHADDWMCPGCGTVVADGDPRGHINRCDFVDGAGHPLGGAS